MKILVAGIALLLSGCASYKQVYVVPPPVQAGTYVKNYDVYPTFKGFELIVGLPGLRAISPVFSELIQVRAGINQDVVVPTMERYTSGANVMGAAPTSRVVDVSRNRWSSYKHP